MGTYLLEGPQGNESNCYHLGYNMNERIKELAEQCYEHDQSWTGVGQRIFNKEKFAELIVRDCMDVAKNWDDQLISAKLVKESNAVGIVVYRIARQFGVKE